MIPLLMFFVAGAEANRLSDLVKLVEMLPESKAWNQWQNATGELPPDFEAMADRAPLPDPLLFEDGRSVKSADDWQARREELKKLIQHWIFGTVPPPPDNLHAQVLIEQDQDGATVREVELRFGPDQKAKLWLEVMVPKGPGPFPVFLTQYNHRGWALIALRRGYIACVYAGCDERDDTDTFLPVYPECDWSRLTRRAWAASRCIDYLTGLPEVRANQIAITGHSRNGKLSLIASALDERIAAVISSSSGAGGSLAARIHGDPQFAENIESITRSFPEWFHPRWRFFAGREHKAPVDLHELVALSAPRACLISTALNDGVESTWGIQQTYLAVKPAYRLLGAEDKLRILWRAGGHETSPVVIERYVDWLDTQFGRGSFPFPERLIHPWDWDAWKKAAPAMDVNAVMPRPAVPPATRDEWESRKPQYVAGVRAMMGTPPPEAVVPAVDYGSEPEHVEKLLRRAAAPPELEVTDDVFGEYISANVYMPKETAAAGKRLPSILWLHPWSCPTGYGAAYKRGDQAYIALARAGFAVFCYDQIGFGRRVEEVEGFYTRYPAWSLLGKMVRDAQAAMDRMRELPYINPDQIFVVGYGLGAMVGLHMAAFDTKAAGYAFFAPPPSFRLDTDNARTGGARRWSHDYMLLPRLGDFIGHEDRLPYDIDDLMAMAAPRPALVVNPMFDYANPPDLAQQAVLSAGGVYALFGDTHTLAHRTPSTFNNFDPAAQQVVIQWLKEMVTKE